MQDASQSWPLDTHQNVIPSSITQFLHTMLTGERECKTSSERVRCLATSFGSDLVFGVANGWQKKPPKHVLLFYVVWTGNRNDPNYESPWSLCVFYSMVEEIDTALCIQKLECLKCHIPLPANIYTLVCSQHWPGITSTDLKIP
jgi:hypothetical protein